MAQYQAHRQCHAVALDLPGHCAVTVCGQAAVLQPMVELTGQRHGVSGDDEAVKITPNCRADLLGKQGRPEPLDRRQRPQMLALLRPGRPLLGDPCPEGIALLTTGAVELMPVGGQPLGLAGQGVAPAAFVHLFEGTNRLGCRQDPLGQLVDGRIEHAGIGDEKVGPVFPLDIPLQHLPGLAGEETGRLIRHGAEEGGHRLGKLRGIGNLLAIRRGADQRKGHRGPMHFGETRKLAAGLLEAIEGFIQRLTCLLEQPLDHLSAHPLHPVTDMVATALGQDSGTPRRHQRDEPVGQCSREERIGVGVGAPLPEGITEQFIWQATPVAQPEIDLWNTAQAREEHRVRPQFLDQWSHGLPGETRQQVRASPEVGGGTGGGDEGLYRADAHRQQRRLPVFVSGKSSGKGGGQIQVLPDGMVRHPAVGGQLPPEGAQLGVVFLLVQFRAEAPEGEQGPFRVVATLFPQAVEVCQAACSDVVGLGFLQPPLRAQVDLFAADGMDQHRFVGPAHLVAEILRPLWAISRRGPPVGALDRRRINRVQRQRLAQGLDRAALVARAGTHQDQRLFTRIVQAGIELGLPESFVVHDWGSFPSAATMHIGRCTMMRTNIVLDDELVAEAMKLSGAKTKREVVEMALHDLVMRHRLRKLKELQGMELIDPDYAVIAERHATRRRVPD